MPLYVFKQSDIEEVRPTTINLQLADRPIAHLDRKTKDVLAKVERFIFLADFIVLDYEAEGMFLSY